MRCPSCGEENSDRATFCQNGATSDEVATDVTVVFADVTGSTSLGEQRDPGA